MPETTAQTPLPASHHDSGEPFRNAANFTHIGKSALGYTAIAPTVAASEAQYTERIQQEREQLLSLERHTEGINLKRVHAYREQMGAPEKPLLFLTPENFAKAVAIAGGDTREGSGSDAHGRYFENQDVIAVRRDPELEALNGTAWSESVAAHEGGHSSGTINPVAITTKTTGRWRKKTEIDTTRSRTGFLVSSHEAGADKRGSLIEEGYAEYERGQYVKQLGNKDGVLIERPELLNDFPGRQEIGAHYWHLDRSDTDGSPEPAVSFKSVVGAVILETLIGADPQLLPALRLARQSGAGLREVAQRINALEPGLYQAMQSADINTDDGLKGAIELSGQVSDRFAHTN